MTHIEGAQETAPTAGSVPGRSEARRHFWTRMALRLAGLLALSFACGLVGVAVDLAANGHGGVTAVARQVGTGGMALVGLLCVRRWARQARVGWGQIWGRKPDADGVVYCALAGALICMAHETLILALRGQLPLAPAPGTAPLAVLVADVVAGGLLVAAYEESFFRGLLPSLLSAQGYGSTAVARLTTLLFTLLHVDHYAAPLRLLWIAVLGHLAIHVRRRSGSLWTCMVLHLSHNTVGFVIDWVFGTAGR